MYSYKVFIKADGEGNFFLIIRYDNGTEVIFPTNQDGSLKWWEDRGK